ncbi:hypothetical protein Mapa_015388 [Marchantia paleacea]|nr:hypothetical protein Mapa_015388 [Marchantia paleacea]
MREDPPFSSPSIKLKRPLKPKRFKKYLPHKVIAELVPALLLETGLVLISSTMLQVDLRAKADPNKQLLSKWCRDQRTIHKKHT